MIAVVGGSGKLGGYIVEQLAGQDVVAVARTDRSAAELQGRGVKVVRGDLDDPSSLRSAFEGVTRLVMVTPYDPQQGEREISAIDAAEAAGVQHIVKGSSYAAGIEPAVPISAGHKAAERRLRESGMSWTVLRPDWWIDNLLVQLDHVREGEFFFPAHGAQVSAIDARDIAEVAVAELLAERPYGGVLTLTGPEMLGFEEIAERVGVAAGRPLTFHDDVAPVWSEGYANAVRSLFAHYRERGRAPFTHTVTEILGRPPRSIDDFGREVLGPLLRTEPGPGED
ncbi:MAG TPA: NAD(P)H-binding protein [Baekduia sp.]|nr:NAD(P)H-binding protein [Baekduia sp.]